VFAELMSTHTVLISLTSTHQTARCLTLGRVSALSPD